MLVCSTTKVSLHRRAGAYARSTASTPLVSYPLLVSDDWRNTIGAKSRLSVSQSHSPQRENAHSPDRGVPLRKMMKLHETYSIVHTSRCDGSIRLYHGAMTDLLGTGWEAWFHSRSTIHVANANRVTGPLNDRIDGSKLHELVGKRLWAVMTSKLYVLAARSKRPCMKSLLWLRTRPNLSKFI